MGCFPSKKKAAAEEEEPVAPPTEPPFQPYDNTSPSTHSQGIGIYLVFDIARPHDDQQHCGTATMTPATEPAAAHAPAPHEGGTASTTTPNVPGHFQISGSQDNLAGHPAAHQVSHHEPSRVKDFAQV